MVAWRGIGKVSRQKRETMKEQPEYNHAAFALGEAAKSAAESFDAMSGTLVKVNGPYTITRYYTNSPPTVEIIWPPRTQNNIKKIKRMRSKRKRKQAWKQYN